MGPYNTLMEGLPSRPMSRYQLDGYGYAASALLDRYQDYDQPPQTAIFRGYPGHYKDSLYNINQEEREQQTRERAQNALLIQQHFAAQRSGTNLTGYEPATTTIPGGVVSRADSAFASDETRALPVFGGGRVVSSTPAVTMPRGFQEFFPKQRPTPIEVSKQPDTLSELVIHSAAFDKETNPDPRLSARQALESAQAFEPSTMTDEELRASVPLVSKHPEKLFRGPGGADETQYLKDLDDWWNSGRKAFEDTEAYAKTLLTGQGKLDDKDACVGTPLMVGLFKTLQGYQQKRDCWSCWK